MNVVVVESPAKAPAASLPDESRRLAVLTSREVDVLTLIARGRTNAEIAAELHLSGGTVKTHIGHILVKLNLRDRVQAVILGFQCGLVSAGEADRRPSDG